MSKKRDPKWQDALSAAYKDDPKPLRAYLRRSGLVLDDGQHHDLADLIERRTPRPGARGRRRGSIPTLDPYALLRERILAWTSMRLRTLRASQRGRLPYGSIERVFTKVCNRFAKDGEFNGLAPEEIEQLKAEMLAELRERRP